MMEQDMQEILFTPEALAVAGTGKVVPPGPSVGVLTEAANADGLGLRPPLHVR